MKKSKTTIILIIFFVIFILLSLIFKDTFNMFLENIFLIKDRNIVFKDELVNEYINTLENEIKEYKKISDLEDCIMSSVIYRDPTIWYDKVTINKGSNDGVNANNLVVNDSGIVGIVTKIYKNSSEITLLTNIDKDKKITVGLVNDEKEVYGIISKYDKNKNEIFISELTSEISVDNTNVVTTDFTNTFKDGLIIGKVLDIKMDNNGLSYNAIVKPNVDYNNIKYVCVIK